MLLFAGRYAADMLCVISYALSDLGQKFGDVSI